MTAPSATGANGNFVIVADYGDSIDVREDETYADELQADADADNNAVIYGVYELTAAPR